MYKSQQSALNHLVHSVLGLRYSGSALFSMMTAYFDESGGKDKGFMAVCGWAATVYQWGQFEIDWKVFLAHFGVPYFHMSEFAQSKAAFEKFENNEYKRRRFLSTATDIIRASVQRGFYVVITQRTFDAVDQKYELKESFTPYALAGRSAIAHARVWAQPNKHGPLNINFVFEDGFPDKSTLVTALTKISPVLPIPSFEPGRDQRATRKKPYLRKGLVQLQAADFLAYEAGKATRDRITRRTRQFRQSLQQLLNIPIDLVIPNVQDLEKFCELAKLTPRK